MGGRACEKWENLRAEAGDATAGWKVAPSLRRVKDYLGINEPLLIPCSFNDFEIFSSRGRGAYYGHIPCSALTTFTLSDLPSSEPTSHFLQIRSHRKRSTNRKQVTMATTKTASALPSRLQDFFARYPPQHYSAKFTRISIPLTRRDAKEAAIIRAAQIDQTTSSPTPRSAKGILAQPILLSSTTSPASKTLPPAESKAQADQTDTSISTPTPPTSRPLPNFPPNPFLPTKRSGHWAGPRIGLRRQAELVRLARQYEIEDLLPPGKKSTVFKETRLLERGLRIRGTGEGQKVKGHKWERRIDSTLDKRRKAMENMPAMIREWKQKGHGRGWAKYPSSKASKN